MCASLDLTGAPLNATLIHDPVLNRLTDQQEVESAELLPGHVRRHARPTIREVAAMAGVSFKTVSRVVNAEAGVSGKLDARVRAAIDRLDYRPNLAATNLRRGNARSGTIGLLLPDVATPFFARLLRAVEDVALRRGALVIAGSSDDSAAREHELVAAFASRRVDGLIILTATRDQSHLVREGQCGTAMVVIDRVIARDAAPLGRAAAELLFRRIDGDEI